MKVEGLEAGLIPGQCHALEAEVGQEVVVAVGAGLVVEAEVRVEVAVEVCLGHDQGRDQGHCHEAEVEAEVAVGVAVSEVAAGVEVQAEIAVGVFQGQGLDQDLDRGHAAEVEAGEDLLAGLDQGQGHAVLAEVEVAVRVAARQKIEGRKMRRRSLGLLVTRTLTEVYHQTSGSRNVKQVHDCYMNHVYASDINSFVKNENKIHHLGCGKFITGNMAIPYCSNLCFGLNITPDLINLHSVLKRFITDNIHRFPTRQLTYDGNVLICCEASIKIEIQE